MTKAKTNTKQTAAAPKVSLMERLGKWVYDKRAYFLIFAVPFIIMYIAYAIFKVHPFGEESVLVLDLNGQYVYFYEAFRDAFWGEGSFIYDWGRNLSGEMFGIFAYYLASPFMLIVCLLPRSYMCGAIELMQLAKIGTAAVTFAFFLNKTSEKKPKLSALVTFSTCYALMSYMVVELMDPMWLDGLIYLPLIFWGVKRFVDDKVMMPYIIPLALMFIAHFYIGYMVGIFTLFYFVYYCLSREGRILPKNFFGACWRFFIGTVTALLISCWVLIPVYNSLKLGKMEFSQADFTIRTQFDLLQFTSKLFPMSYDTVRPEGLPMVYCGTIAVVLLPLFFLNSKISMKEKVSKGLLLLATVICMYIAPVDIALHGFQVPNWLPYRYSFVFSFFMLVIAYRAYENLDGITTKELGSVFFGLCALLIYLDTLGYDHFGKISYEVLEENKKDYTIGAVWFSLIAVGAMYLMLYLVKKYNTKLVCWMLAGVVGVEMLAVAHDTVIKIDEDVAYSTYESYAPYMQDVRDTVEAVNKFDGGEFFRMESTYHRTVCDPIGTGYYGISHSSSTMNAPALMALKYMGYAYGGNYTKYQGTTPITDSIFAIKYLMNWETQYAAHTKIPAYYNQVLTTKDTGTNISVYENPYALSVGFAADKMMQSFMFDERNPFWNQNMIVNYALGDKGDRPFTEYMERVYPEIIDTVNLSTVPVSENHTKYYFTDSSIGECHEDFVFTMPKSGNLYMYFPTMYERKVNIWLARDDVFSAEDDNFEFAGYFFTGDHYSILNLGQFNEGESVRVRLSIPTEVGEAYWSDELFYVFNEEQFKNDITLVQENLWEITEFDDTYIEGNITVGENQLLFTTVPYEEGWTVEVDGKKVEPIIIADTFIAVDLAPGEHTVSMSYMPNYFIISIILSICGVLLAAVIFVFEYKNGKIIKKIMKKVK